MSVPNWPVATFADVTLMLGDWLAHLKRRGRLPSLLREAVVEQFVLDRARQEGLVVAAEELQQAADAFRRRHGFISADETRAWLAGQHLSLVEFEDALERDLLIEKFKDRLTQDRIAGHFETQRSSYARARLRLIVVGGQDQARELVLQIRDEGGDFAVLAREHSAHSSRSADGSLGWVMRRQLPPDTADRIFAARQGALIGPLASPQGFQVFLVEELREPRLDAALTALVRQELFEAWLNEQLSVHKLGLAVLEEL